MATSSRSQVLSLYRMLIKESKKFPAYNYRTYALRRIRDGFRENRNVSDPKTLDALFNRAWDGLAVVQRQVAIGKLYVAQKTVVEDQGVKKAN
ncbi:hypothetical protein SKAU_G00056560 [Synaphobranchus kaupii]|uniref:Complex 1 LYR protein domain-containing protein n=1 Tax=Synaphobranchus kaupii TaxID=118154 RepID=A0A9Q1J964_SYNKA|nr:hypothetical protein SKAU_G00056560 [Synaphobranchus kaupii]